MLVFDIPRAWKRYDWDVMDQLDEDDYIDNGSPRSKSTYLTPSGIDYALSMIIVMTIMVRKMNLLMKMV